MNSDPKFEMANGDNPEQLITATQKAMFGALQDSLKRLKNEMGGPGLTWEQLEYLIDTFKVKKPTIVIQEYEA